MSERKPYIFSWLKIGETIYQRVGFVACWNWMLSCWANIKCGLGLQLTGMETGEPQLNLNLEAGSGITIEESDNNALKISGSGGSDEVDVITGISFFFDD